MNKKIQLGPKDIIFPVPAALVVTGTYENPNILAVAWIGMISSNPPVIGISLNKDRYSFEVINRNKQFSINFPSSKYYVETDYCGLVSGRKVNKFQETGFTPIKSMIIEPPIIQECPFNMECTVLNEMSFNNYQAFFGKIVETHVDSDKINGSKFTDIDISKIDPLVYMATIREYWTIGNKLGNSYEAGKNIDKIKNTK